MGDGDGIGQIIDVKGGATPVFAPFNGIVRGIIHPTVPVTPGMKIGDIDPRIEPQNCRTVSDKSLAIGGGALEALLTMMNQSSQG